MDQQAAPVHRRPDRVLVLGRTIIELWPGNYTRTILPDGAEVHAVPQDNEGYRARARALGYEDRTDLLSREHEVGHVLLAHMLGLPESPALRSAADVTPPSDLTGFEESAVMALQRFCREAGLDLFEVASRIARGEPPVIL